LLLYISCLVTTSDKYFSDFYTLKPTGRYRQTSVYLEKLCDKHSLDRYHHIFHSAAAMADYPADFPGQWSYDGTRGKHYFFSVVEGAYVYQDRSRIYTKSNTEQAYRPLDQAPHVSRGTEYSPKPTSGFLGEHQRASVPTQSSEPGPGPNTLPFVKGTRRTRGSHVPESSLQPGTPYL